MSGIIEAGCLCTTSNSDDTETTGGSSTSTPIPTLPVFEDCAILSVNISPQASNSAVTRHMAWALRTRRSLKHSSVCVHELNPRLLANIICRPSLLTTFAIAIRDADYLERDAVETLQFLKALQLDLFINDLEEPAELTPLFGVFSQLDQVFNVPEKQGDLTPLYDVFSQLDQMCLTDNWYDPSYTTLAISNDISDEDSLTTDPFLHARLGIPWMLATDP
ncbi:hypothetical protein BGX33_000270 [Mortierella sp. NVP41]|nr:hypothetical protein BGX33_000270 [Mortierella sp. NVP41]